jgi:hypothetical protein
MSSEHDPYQTPSPGQAQTTAPSVSGRPGVAGFWTHPATVVGAAGVVLLLVTTLAIVALRSTVGGAPAVGSGRSPGSEGGAVPINGSPSVKAPVGAIPNGGPAAGSGSVGGGAGTAPGAQGGTTGAQTGRTPSSEAPPSTATAPDVTYRELRSGKLTLVATEQADLDTGTTASEEVSSSGRPEMVLKKQSIKAKGAAAFSIWTGSGAPTPQACVAATDWFIELTADQVSENRVLCVRTNDNRPAEISFLAVGRDAKGKLSTVTISYTVWVTS